MMRVSGLIKAFLFFGAIFLSFENNLSASTSTSPAFYKSGIYIGIANGFSMFKGKVKNVFDDEVNGGKHSEILANASDTRYVFELLLGARHLLKDNFILGIDISTSFAGHQFKMDFNHDNLSLGILPPYPLPMKLTVEKQYSIVPAITIGWIFNQRFQLYGKLGLSISSFKTTLDNTRNSDGQSYSKNVTKYGIAPTLGLEYALTPNISLTLSSTYEYYKPFTIYYNRLVDLNNTDNGSNRLKLSVFTQKIGFIYKF
jgi:hypothetical protein